MNITWDLLLSLFCYQFSSLVFSGTSFLWFLLTVTLEAGTSWSFRCKGSCIVLFSHNYPLRQTWKETFECLYSFYQSSGNMILNMIRSLESVVTCCPPNNMLNIELESCSDWVSCWWHRRVLGNGCGRLFWHCPDHHTAGRFRQLNPAVVAVGLTLSLWSVLQAVSGKGMCSSVEQFEM